MSKNAGNSASWRRLDNAAKIFPSNSSLRDPKVFRFTCEIIDAVEPDILQFAAERTLNLFPFFRYTMRHGFFWYYLEDTQLPVTVSEENEFPCQPLYLDASSPLYRITYWQNRINVEVYHALTDGTGAMEFLRTLICQYLQQAYAQQLRGVSLDLGVDASVFQKMGDSFDKYYTGLKGKNERNPHAYRLKGERFPPGKLRVIIGDVPVDILLQQAHEHGVTMTVLLAANLLCAIGEEMAVRDYKHPVVATIPVNLRNFFDSDTARNFFSIVNIGVRFDRTPCQLDAVAAALKDELSRKLTREALQARLNLLASLEHNPFTRILPLVLKDPVMNLAGRLSNQTSTVSFSNVGKVSMPPELAPYIRKFDVFIATAGVQMCSCSYQNTLSLAFTSSFIGTDIERRFFRRLQELGIPVVLSTNLPTENEDE